MPSANADLVQITKATRAKPSEPMKALNFANDPHGLKRLEKTRAQTPQGIMRVADTILEEALEYPLPHKPKAESSPRKEPKYAEQRCKTIDPNCYRAPFNRIRSPREMRNRRPEGWQNGRIVLPKVTWEGLRAIAISARLGRPGGASRYFPVLAE